jgi:NAD(P)-dependent dehydrogenase (short-subunit alcohol dehydrogenase family)
VALVTDGARGIGFEVVRRFAQQDMMVVMTLVLAARDLDKAIAAFDTSRSWLML